MKHLTVILTLALFPFGAELVHASGGGWWKTLVQKRAPAARQAAANETKTAAVSAMQASKGYALQRISQLLTPELFRRNSLAGLEAVERNLPRSLVQLVGRKGNFASNGFVFDDTFGGECARWIAVPYHTAAPRGQNTVLLKLQGADGKPVIGEFKLDVCGAGGLNSADMCLIRLDGPKWKHLQALEWSLRVPQKGARLASYGCRSNECRTFGLDEFDKVSGREVLLYNQYRLTTSYEFADGCPYGACGSPLLDRDGKVLGMHSGSMNRKLSFAVTREGVEDLLAKYYYGSAGRMLMYKGRKIRRVGVDERLQSIRVLREGALFAEVNLELYFQYFNFSELEK